MRMKFWVAFATALSLAATLAWYQTYTSPTSTVVETSNALFQPPPKVRSTSSPKASGLQKKARTEYFHKMLRDPKTKQIPDNVRVRELNTAQQLRERFPSNKRKANWTAIGPDNVGGRTRALAIDVRDSNTIIAGGVTGGIWKSTDGGLSWGAKTDPSEPYSVTWVTQDPRPGNQDTWYYGGGEWTGNSTFGSSGYITGNLYTARGIYKSTDNGETWTLVPNTADNTITRIATKGFEFIQKIVISPTTGTVIAATNIYGLARSSAGADIFSFTYGRRLDFIYSDVAVNSNGVFLGVCSTASFANANTFAPGVVISTNDGQNWTNITPADFPGIHERSVVTFAPSNPNRAYIMTYTGEALTGFENREDVRMFKVDIDPNGGNHTFTDVSANMPPFDNSTGAFITQGNYNMTLKVKPDNPDFVLFGGTNLHRTTDGFATPVSSLSDWIAGYGPREGEGISFYENHHPDQHNIAFDPSNPNRVFSSHDGGISVTNNINAAEVTWEYRVDGYITTQFYAATINATAGDPRAMGGTQDNGTPFLATNIGIGSLGDVSSGDGGPGYFGTDFMYVSRQVGDILRIPYTTQDDLPGVLIPDFSDFAFCFPEDESNQSFIHPFVIDPVTEEVMFYPGSNNMWRNRTLKAPYVDDRVPGFEPVVSLDMPADYTITALEMTIAPAGRLYYAGYNGDNAPLLYRVDDPYADVPTAINISSPLWSEGTWPNDIAVNPANGDEIMLVISNYETESLFYSSDGGSNWSAVGGNINSAFGAFGPSVRAAEILPKQDGSRDFIVGTSTGIYTTNAMNGGGTVWTPEGTGVFSTAVVSSLDSRASDGRVVAGTHGLGMYEAFFEGTAVANENQLVYPWISNNAGNFESVLVANNLSSASQTVTLTARRADGSSETTTRTIAAKGFLREAASDLFPDLGSGAGYTVTLAAQTDELRGGWVTNNLTALSGQSPSQGVAVKADGSDQVRVGTGIVFGYLPVTSDFFSAPVIVNMGSQPADVTINLYDAEGGTVNSTFASDLEPFTPFAVVANDLTLFSSAPAVYATVSSDQPLTGVSFVFNDLGETAIGNVTAVDNKTETATKELVYPWVSNNEGSFQSILYLNNISFNAVDITLTARRADGTSESVSRQIAPLGALFENASTLFPGLGSGPGYTVFAELNCNSCNPSGYITGGWVTNNLQAASGSSPSQGIAIDPNVAGSERYGEDLLFSYLPLENSFSSAPVLVNLGNAPIDVTLRYYDTAGNEISLSDNTLTGLQPLQPFAAVTNALVPGGTGDVQLVIDSNGGKLTGVSFVFNTVFFEPAIGNATGIIAE